MSTHTGPRDKYTHVHTPHSLGNLIMVKSPGIQKLAVIIYAVNGTNYASRSAPLSSLHAKCEHVS